MDGFGCGKVGLDVTYTGGVASNLASGYITVAASVTTVTLALERSILTPAVNTVLSGLALGAIRSKPSGVASIKITNKIYRKIRHY